MPFRDIHGAALTSIIAAVITLGLRLMRARQACNRCNTGHPRAWSIARFPIPTPSRAREPLSRPTRGTLRASSISASPSPVRGSFAKPSRRSRGVSRSSRTTRCFSDGAGIDIFPCVNSIVRSPISRAAAPSTARSTESHICVFSRGDQDSARCGSIQCRVTSWMEAP